jgi:hypothetical protein
MTRFQATTKKQPAAAEHDPEPDDASDYVARTTAHLQSLRQQPQSAGDHMGDTHSEDDEDKYLAQFATRLSSSRHEPRAVAQKQPAVQILDDNSDHGYRKMTHIQPSSGIRSSVHSSAAVLRGSAPKPSQSTHRDTAAPGNQSAGRPNLHENAEDADDESEDSAYLRQFETQRRLTTQRKTFIAVSSAPLPQATRQVRFKSRPLRTEPPSEEASASTDPGSDIHYSRYPVAEQARRRRAQKRRRQLGPGDTPTDAIMIDGTPPPSTVHVVDLSSFPTVSDPLAHYLGPPTIYPRGTLGLGQATFIHESPLICTSTAGVAFPAPRMRPHAIIDPPEQSPPREAVVIGPAPVCTP